MQDETLDTSEAAALLKICTKTLLKYWREGLIPGRRVGRNHRFLRSDLLGFIHGGSNRNSS